MLSTRLLLVIILVTLGACQQSDGTEEPLPTLAVLPTLELNTTPSPAPTASPVPPSATPTLTITPTFTPSMTPTVTRTPTPAPTWTPGPPPTLLPESFIFGRSVEGRDLLAWRVGSGGRLIFIVGGIHNGFEYNTSQLVNDLRDHFQRNPGDVLPGIGLVLIPLLNPDGAQSGRDVDGRFNARGVDLNRNWDCGWSPTAEWRLGPVNPGVGPFSEPETQALASLALDLRPVAVIIYHAAANGVFAGDCNGRSISMGLAAAYGQSSLYPFGEPFREYELTGTAPNWLDSMGIPAVDVELATDESTEFTRNLSGIKGVQFWALNGGQG